ncbi:MAG: hypothetical protein ACOH2V_09655 [Candidatus Saccharimonadaceae bacterium]
MKKLILLVAIATTISFAACTNVKTTEQPEEATIENAEQALDNAAISLDSAAQAVEEVADSLVTPAN